MQGQRSNQKGSRRNGERSGTGHRLDTIHNSYSFHGACLASYTAQRSLNFSLGGLGRVYHNFQPTETPLQKP